MENERGNTNGATDRTKGRTTDRTTDRDADLLLSRVLFHFDEFAEFERNHPGVLASSIRESREKYASTYQVALQPPRFSFEIVSNPDFNVGQVKKLYAAIEARLNPADSTVGAIGRVRILPYDDMRSGGFAVDTEGKSMKTVHFPAVDRPAETGRVFGITWPIRMAGGGCVEWGTMRNSEPVFAHRTGASDCKRRATKSGGLFDDYHRYLMFKCGNDGPAWTREEADIVKACFVEAGFVFASVRK